jgi:hypothetical protein
LQRAGQSDSGKFSPWALFYRVLSLWWVGSYNLVTATIEPVLTGIDVSRHVSSGDDLTDEGRAAVIQQVNAIQADIIVQNRNGKGEYTWHAQDWLNCESEYDHSSAADLI